MSDSDLQKALERVDDFAWENAPHPFHLAWGSGDSLLFEGKEAGEYDAAVTALVSHCAERHEGRYAHREVVAIEPTFHLYAERDASSSCAIL